MLAFSDSVVRLMEVRNQPDLKYLIRSIKKNSKLKFVSRNHQRCCLPWTTVKSGQTHTCVSQRDNQITVECTQNTHKQVNVQHDNKIINTVPTGRPPNSYPPTHSALLWFLHIMLTNRHPQLPPTLYLRDTAVSVTSDKYGSINGSIKFSRT